MESPRREVTPRRLERGQVERAGVPPVVCDPSARQAGLELGEVEAAAARAVGMIEGETGLVEKDLEDAGLVADLHPAAGEDQRATDGAIVTAPRHGHVNGPRPR